MKVVVTGGAGYIGSHAVYSLIEKGNQVVIIDNLSRGYMENVHPDATFYNADIRDVETIKGIFKKEGKIDGIMHFAGYIVVPESVEKPLMYFNNNTYSVEKLLEAADDAGIKNVVFSSTAAVYGETSGAPIKESDTKTPVNPYGESKLAAEAIIRGWTKARGTNHVIFRYFNVAGAHPSGKIGIRGKGLTHLLPSVIEGALGIREKFVAMGTDYPTRDGSCIRDFIHVMDLVEAHIIGLEWSIKNKESNIFNLGSGSGHSVLEVLNTAIKELEIAIPNEMGDRRAGDPAELLADVSNARDVLGWKTKQPLDVMIRSEYDFRKKLKK
ncbi:UDP-glucose 4-epimerase GalE [Mycoplasma marinum]|uniref:UDP-glucose 4-epimerase n=1 Tax=Mycoplasma marinum TaxID=1937190 RepID=A0A4R0XUS4_9MOLU|nr:UDP-glucose 4-epimerase GalE [Mycoplasma marinum]TCG10641.1 UDP-glucose 4-epimerase GalE [Mycoplasma marinum]